MLLINRCIIILAFSYSMDYALITYLMALAGTIIAEFMPYFLVWAVGSFVGIFVPEILPFSLGGLMFVVGELFTLGGVKLLPFVGLNKVHVLKGAHRKGELTEYILVAMVVIAMIILPKHDSDGQTKNFVPYMYNWEDMYNQGLIDPREWKEHRFDYF